MNTIPVHIKQAIATHAQKHPTEEVCGLVLKDGTVLPIENILPEGDINDIEEKTRHNDFQMPDGTLPVMAEKIQAVYHSHWRESSAALLSDIDLRVSRAVSIPYILYHTTFDQWDLFDPNGIHPWTL